MGQTVIYSNSSQPFEDRREAGRLLAQFLPGYKGNNPVILGIPRGGLVIAGELASYLGGELDIIVSRKLRTPGYPELAMGSISESGEIFINPSVASSAGIDSEQIEEETKFQLDEIKRRIEFIRKEIPKIPLAGRLVIVTDDGVATGATFQTALAAARAENPRQLVAAIPVGSNQSIDNLAKYADTLYCLRVPPVFAAVGQFYTNFEPVTDDEVLEILKRNRSTPASS